MKKRNWEKLPVGTLLRYSRSTNAMLGARKGTRSYAGPMKEAHNGLKKAQAAYADAQDAAIDADALVSTVLYDSHEFVTDFELALFTEVRKNRRSERYQTFFSTTMTKVKTKNSADFHQWLVDFQDKKLLKLDKDDALRKKFEKRLQELLPEWKKPLAEQHACDLAEQEAGRKLDQAKVGWSNAYVSLHGALEKDFPGRTAFVESFFRYASKTSGAKKKKSGDSGQKTTEKAQAAKTAKSGTDQAPPATE